MTSYREKIQTHLLDCLRRTVDPSLRPEALYILAENIFVAIDDPAVNSNYSILSKISPVNFDTSPRNVTLKNETSAGMNPECFVDHG